ncbi:hypothetical protein SSBR45G_27600 [Bradyrhizobium sp. SSBR45G]|uniref:hydrolase n=1 Tax=unclassified Bradyrhizobium TaxID=2631580 RepID=UPI002342BA4C|nr:MULTISPECIES: hydrolase [unclassified Bradyrhizobium]GLH77852.1 hypothetical protein SSBR45G_27600 [Bradyrhizobium sp. SSBR45G]GLH85526.1 hypothetical protein SSBR45R_29860 [Bradyrhizobium sp. SSBR45R]
MDPHCTSRSPMRRYLVAMVLTCALTTFSIGLFGIRFGVWFSPAILADLQSIRPDSIALPFDLRYNSAFMLRRVAAIQPDIVAIGSSRASGFSAAAFAPRRFYNLCFTAWSVQQIADELKRVTSAAKPRIAIVTLDYFLFSDRWETSNADRAQIHGEPLRYFKASITHWVHSAWREPWILSNALRSPLLGTQALISKEGFGTDGAYRFSDDHIAKAKTQLNAQHLERAFFGGEAISPHQKDALEQLAALARSSDLTLIAIQLPILHDAVDFLDHDARYEPYAGLWRDFETDATRAWLAETGIHFFDLARSDIGNDASHFIDSVHLSEAGMRRVMDELNADPDFRRLIQ